MVRVDSWSLVVSTVQQVIVLCETSPNHCHNDTQRKQGYIHSQTELYHITSEVCIKQEQRIADNLRHRNRGLAAQHVIEMT